MVMVAAAIVLTSQYIKVTPSLDPWFFGYVRIETVGHVALYFCLGFFIARYVTIGLGIPRWAVLALTVSSCVTFGVFDELHQTFVENRNAEFDDLLADLVGGFTGALVYILWADLKRRLQELRSMSDVRVGFLLAFAGAALAIAALVYGPAVVAPGTTDAVFLPIGARGAEMMERVLDTYPQPRSGRKAEKASKEKSRSVSRPAEKSPTSGTKPNHVREAERSVPAHESIGRVGKVSVKNARVHAASLPESSSLSPAGAGKRQNSAEASPRPDYVRYLGRFKQELAVLEIKEIHMTPYSSRYGPLVVLREKIAYMRVTISRIEENPSLVPLEATVANSIDKYRQELADLEIKEVHMAQYRPDYKPRALLRKKIAKLRKIISRIEETPSPAPLEVTTLNYVDKFRQALVDLEIQELHMEQYSEDYVPRALLIEKIGRLKERISQIEKAVTSTDRHSETKKQKGLSETVDTTR